MYGSENYVTGAYGYLQANLGNGAGSSLSTTVDAYGSGVIEGDRNAEDISGVLVAAGNGRSLDQIWTDMCALADQIAARQFTYDPSEGALPVGVTANSNSLIASVLALIGVDVTQHIGGTPPSLGFPGDQTILSGSGDDFLRGFAGNDTLLNAGGGNDILHGGDGTQLIRSDLWDGKDTVLYKEYSLVEVSVEDDFWSVTKNTEGAEFTDTLYSIESLGSYLFRIMNKVRLTELQEGKTIKDRSSVEMLELQDDVGGEIQSLMTVSIDNIDIEFFNFGTIIATNYADTFALNQLIGRSFNGGDGSDVVSYEGISSHGIRAVLDGAGGGEILHHDGVPVATIGGLTGLLPTRETLTSIESVFGTAFNDTFNLNGLSVNLTIDGDHHRTMGGFSGTTVIGNVEYSPPSGSPHPYTFFTNRGHDVLDLSGMTEGATVQRGGATMSGTTVIAGESSKILVDVDSDILTARGIEEVKLGSGDDLLIVGRVTQNAGTETLHTKFDMGDGTNDVVRVWGDAVLRDGVIYTRDGAEVTGFETIDLTVSSGSVGNYMPTFKTESLGYTYTKASATSSWLDYSSIGESLYFSLGNSGYVLSSYDPDILSGRFNIVGSNQGDTIYANSGRGFVRLGSGANEITIGGFSQNGFYYGGGEDTYYSGSYAYYVGLLPDVDLGDLTVSHDNITILANYGFARDYRSDVIVEVDGQGSMTFSDARTWTQYAGGDGIFGTGDDFIVSDTHKATLTLMGTGQINLSQTGAAQLLNTNGTHFSVPEFTVYDFDTTVVNGTSGADTLEANSFEDSTVTGGAGNDEIMGGFGHDTLSGGDGHDYIRGGAGNDTLYGGDGNDILSGDAGDDTLIGGAGDDVMIGGAGRDTFHIEGNDRVLDYFIHEGDTLLGVSWLESGMSSSKSGQNLILTQSSNSLTILNFFDTVENGGVGSDYVRMTLDTGERMVRIDADGSIASISQGATSGNDTLSGTSGDDVLFGFAGNDSLSGLGGNDYLYGGDGDDTLFGGDDDDVLVGGIGSDALYGGDGADVFAFLSSDVGNGIDTLHDFSLTDEDVIDLRDVLSGYDPLEDDIADFVQFTNAGSNSELAVDLDGAGTVYGWTQVATINGHINLDAVTLETNGHLLAA